MVIQILASVSLLIVGMVLQYLWDRNVVNRPRLAVHFAKRGGSSSGGDDDRRECVAHVELTIANVSKTAAIDVKLTWPDGDAILPIDLPEFVNIDGLGRTTVGFLLRRYYSRAELQGIREVLAERHPLSFVNGRFLLSYGNQFDKKFYALVELVSGEPRITYPRRPPTPNCSRSRQHHPES